MIIRNGNVFGEDGRYQIKDIYVEKGTIVECEQQVSDKTIIDAAGCKVLPGLIDVHSHGAVGHDFSDGDAKGLKAILQYEKSQGITSYCPTSMTLPKEQLFTIFSTVNQVKTDERCAAIVGINMEGPFLDPSKKGAHLENCILKPDAALFHECNRLSGGKIKLVTLAPNMPGAEEFTKELAGQVTISLGHTAADYDLSINAFHSGASHVTHIYNAMAPFSHRDPGLVGAAADTPGVMVELIGDGIHIHPAMVRSTFKLFGPERVVLISDSMMAAGMENGTYELGGQQVMMKDRKATLADGTIAGSATNLFDCVRCVINMGIPEETALLAATKNPALSIGIYHQTGSLTPGKRADIVITDNTLNILQVI